MTLKRCAAVLIGALLLLKEPPRRDERGLSQSAETAIIVAGAVGIAVIIVFTVREYIMRELGKL